MAELGYPKEGSAAPILTKENTAAMFELHIEQGPILGSAGVPVGIATASRGNIRFPNAICRGAYAHSAALPRRYRQDAVLAVSELALGLDRYWGERTEAGDDNLVVTVGKFFTDPDQHAMTKVAGEVTFSLNIGAAVLASQEDAKAHALRLIGRIEQERGVKFELGAEVGTAPTPLSEPLLQRLEKSARVAGIATKRMPTAGHDTAMFVRAGIPGAVILVHNDNGSHNPAESLELSDFAAGTRVLAGAMLEIARTSS
jgi:N-carbamoyl-L-amino-acid hydrolase